MAIELTGIIAQYFTADQAPGGEAVAQCFAEHAVVRDEGHTYAGREAIRQWKADTGKKYRYTVEPVALSTEGDRIIVTAHLVGNFPGSPVDLRYHFRIEGEKIAALEVVP